MVRELYAVAAGAWVEAGRTNHHVLVPASDEALADAWFRLDFGQQHLHAVCEPPGRDVVLIPRSELVVRRALHDDLPALAELELVLPRHSAESPIFSRLPVPDQAETLAELEADWDDPKYAIFVAVHEGRVVGSSIGCDLAISSSHTALMRPRHAGFLGGAAVLPEARGLGAGRALGEAVLAWSREAGYDGAATDWRSTNLEADRTWPALGFRPTFRRLHRLIGQGGPRAGRRRSSSVAAERRPTEIGPRSRANNLGATATAGGFRRQMPTCLALSIAGRLSAISYQIWRAHDTSRERETLGKSWQRLDTAQEICS